MPEISIKNALNKAFIKVRPERAAIEAFKGNFRYLLDAIKANPNESEEFLKNLVSDFLKKTWYSDGYFINTKGRMDLVIHNGRDTKTPVGVIIEAKKPGNKTGMIGRGNLNAKAMQELLLYYFRETVDNNNVELKHLIITNTIEWFFFDAHEFFRLFSHDKKLVELYTDFKNGSLPEKDTNFFYTQIAAPHIEKNEAALSYVYFNIADDYEAIIRKTDKAADNRLIRLYKILSPEHLLKQPFVNDSNTLNQNFYTELLYIMGLSEEKEGSKKVIGRNKPEGRKEGSLIENAIFQLSDYTLNENELFDVALELTITWVNRIIFLKLLESQQLQYQKQNPEYSFLNIEKIKNYTDLNTLFFKVLAQETANRPQNAQNRFANVPYLNSSIFDMSETEKAYFPVANLQETELPVFHGTVLRDHVGNKRREPISTLRYIFEFLDAYDFSSEGSEEIQEENKTLINASVLGLIFEKINGYKDGSYFTPGYITTYICRETIRQAVVDKFNEVKSWEVGSFDELKNYVDSKSIAGIKEANSIINSITVCDPAVGSGHFLVSALNEIIAIKSDLGVLADSNSVKLKNCTAEVVNDDLMILDEDEKFYTYNVKNAESRRIQETLFREKRRIIEGSLFGVDINPNSVKICRLRLWIELLKNAYYTKASGYAELETFPNLDINIKCGNSLISRFELDIDLRVELSKLTYTVKDYQDAVYKYKNANAKTEKQDLENLIKAIKNNFRGGIQNNTHLCIKKGSLLNERNIILGQGELFDLAAVKKVEQEKRLNEIGQKIQEIDQQIEDIRINTIYNNAFEWRFEFPELLNEDGGFIGFDVVIGNPPYGVTINKKHYKHRYRAADDIYTVFIEQGASLCKPHGLVSYITPIFWLTGDAYYATRQYITQNISISKGIILPYDVFKEAYIDTGIFVFKKSVTQDILSAYSFEPREKINISNLMGISFFSITREEWIKNDELKLIFDPIYRSLYKKMEQFPTTVNDISTSARGILADKSYYSSKKKEKMVPVFTGKFSRFLLENEFAYIKYNDTIKEKPMSYDFFKGDRLLIRRIVSRQFRIMAMIASTEFVVKKDIYIIKPNGKDYSLKCLLAIINSKLISYMLTNGSTAASKDDFTQITLSDIRNIRIPEISRKQILQIETLVDKILAAKEENPSADTAKLELKIDNIVYGLYGLTDKEVGMLGKA